MFKFFRSPRFPRLSRSPRSRWLRPLISLISLIRSRIARSLHLQISLVILTIFVPLALIVLWYGKHPALAGWWPDGGTAWLNRKQLTLTNNSGGNLNANAVVTVTVDTQSLYTLGKLKSDCSVLRIIYNPNSFLQNAQTSSVFVNPPDNKLALGTAAVKANQRKKEVCSKEIFALADANWRGLH